MGSGEIWQKGPAGARGVTVRKLVDLGCRGGEGRMSRGSGVSGGSRLTKGPGGPSRELKLRLEDSGLHGTFDGVV